MLDVRRLRLLRELHERGTVTAVAQALAYTPSAVSQQLATLEREAGVALVERQGRRLRLTDAGRGLVEHATAVIARLELAESELAAAAGDEVAGRVRRGVPAPPRASCCRCSGRCASATRSCVSSCSRWRPRKRSTCCAAARSSSSSPRSTTSRRARATRASSCAASAATRS